jgi:hypothetical protein
MKLRIGRRSGWLSVVLVLVLAVAACGGDDDDAPNGSAGEGATPTTAASNGGGGEELCRPTPYLVSLRAASGSEVAFEDAQFEVVSAKAVSLAGGAAYTIYMADFEIEDSDIGIVSTPQPGEGETLVTLFITVFNGPANPPAIEAGTEIEFTPDFGVLTFRVTIQQGDETYSSYSEARGSLKVTDVGGSVCGMVTYEDTMTDFDEIQNRLDGPFGAVVVRQN